MTGLKPTVGLAVVLEQTSQQEALQRVQWALQALISVNGWHGVGTEPLTGRARIDGTCLDVMMWMGETGSAMFVFVEFDEEEMVQLSRDRQKVMPQLLQPYLEALQAVEGAVAVGAGFELSVSRDLRAESMRDAGFVILMIRDANRGTWITRQLGPFVGHGT